MKYYIFIFNGLDLMVTGPFPNEDAAMLGESNISLSNTNVAMGGDRIQGLTEFTFYELWPTVYPEFTLPRNKT